MLRAVLIFISILYVFLKKENILANKNVNRYIYHYSEGVRIELNRNSRVQLEEERNKYQID